MSGALHIISNKIPGHGPSDGGNLPCSGVYVRAMGVRVHPPVVNLFIGKGFSLKCFSERMSFLCKASSNNQRRNPRENRQVYSQNRNRQNEERDSSEQLEDPEYLSSKNGPVLSFDNSNKNQATSGPGPREREIVELFQKVQAQLRERTSVKEEKKFEVSNRQNKGSKTVDSLLKLLRKHSVEQEEKKVNGGGFEVSFEQPEQVGTFGEDKGKIYIKNRTQEGNETSSLNRPTSNFKRRSPVPKVHYGATVISSKETVNSFSPFDPDEKSRKAGYPSNPNNLEAKSDEKPEIALVLDVDDDDNLEHETELESSFTDGDVAGRILEFDDEISASQEADDDGTDNSDEEEDEDGEGEEKPAIEHKNLEAMKLLDLRALAKAQGIRRYSKLKKSELIGLLSEEAL